MKSFANDLRQTIFELPQYLVVFFGGLIILVLSQAIMTSLLITAVFASIISSVWVGGLVFFGGYVILKSVGGLGDAIFFAAPGGKKPRHPLA